MTGVQTCALPISPVDRGAVAEVITRFARVAVDWPELAEIELNPLIVEGMVHGATAHGIGAALLEEFRYDDQGQLLTSTFMDYLKPTAMDVPLIEVDRLEHPSPVTPLGAKGVGEGGAIPGPAAVANAVEDALAHLGVVVRSLPITPEQVWHWLR